jgi:hypothetical protein
MGKLLIIASLLLAFLPLFGEETSTRERLVLDPALRGLWMLHAFSEDKGKTRQLFDPPMEFMRADSMTVRMQTAEGAETIHIRKILEVTQSGSTDLYQAVALENGIIWVFDLTAARAGKAVLVQVFEAADKPEKSRLLITIRR